MGIGDLAFLINILLYGKLSEDYPMGIGDKDFPNARSSNLLHLSEDYPMGIGDCLRPPLRGGQEV